VSDVFLLVTLLAGIAACADNRAQQLLVLAPGPRQHGGAARRRDRGPLPVRIPVPGEPRRDPDPSRHEHETSHG
jgi:hypothetical protein